MHYFLVEKTSNKENINMSLAIFQAYLDYCKENNVIPDPSELREWKYKYNYR